MSVEDQKQRDRNVQRVGMFHALRKINALVQEVENEKWIEAQAIKIALGVVGVIGVMLLFYVLVESGRVTSPPSAPLVASDRFTSYVSNWAKQVQAKLGNSCINFDETGSQRVGVTISTSIMKDGTVEKIAVAKSSGIKELDDAAVRGVLAAAPFAPLTIEITRDTDILTITRTFWRVPCQQQFIND